tara:strand:+ start:222 stop:416 length:195 start_codon:yes stop_codon:yes gene_type:complete
MVVNRTLKLIKALREDEELARCVRKVKDSNFKVNVTENVNNLNFDFRTHLFIMANYTELMNIKL